MKGRLVKSQEIPVDVTSTGNVINLSVCSFVVLDFAQGSRYLLLTV